MKHYELKIDKRYEKAWKKLYNKLKALNEIDQFHGLIFKKKKKVSLDVLLEYMDECLEDEK